MATDHHRSGTKGVSGVVCSILLCKERPLETVCSALQGGVRGTVALVMAIALDGVVLEILEP